MIPPILISKINESELYIMTVNGVKISLAGLDNPARIEGSPIDGFLGDETDDVKLAAWSEHVFPCFADRKAWAMFTGVPNGLAYLYELSKKAIEKPDLWDFFTWKSSEVLDADEIENFKSMMDERTFKQEFEASFLNFTGRVYYAFDRENYKHELVYNPQKTLSFCFDFNVSPGIAVVAQEQVMPGQFEMKKTSGGVYMKQPVVGTGVIGEVWIPNNSNTEIVCRKLYNDWKDHKGKIVCYGDAAGGNRTSSGVGGSDWDLIKKYFASTPFRDRITYDYPRANPRVRARINTMNSRCRSVNGIIRFMVDAGQAPKLIDDLERLSLLEGGSGEVDKKKNPEIGHLSDAISYREERLHSITDNKVEVKEF